MLWCHEHFGAAVKNKSVRLEFTLYSTKNFGRNIKPNSVYCITSLLCMDYGNTDDHCAFTTMIVSGIKKYSHWSERFWWRYNRKSCYNIVFSRIWLNVMQSSWCFLFLHRIFINQWYAAACETGRSLNLTCWVSHIGCDIAFIGLCFRFASDENRFLFNSPWNIFL